ncbi:MAG: triphosphoribosyl-dephospho-CoA synthase [Candidatus Caldarchaeales archaeon]
MTVDYDWIASRCVSALLLEVSTTPKPGLVDRYRDFEETLFEHFLISSANLYSCFRQAAEIGRKRKGRGLGETIYKGAVRMISSQKGGNTHLGSILLISPIASASAISKTRPISIETLKKYLALVLKGMDWRDTIYIFNTIRMVAPRGLGRIPFMDVLSKTTYEEIKRLRLRPTDALRPFIDREIVAYEWVKKYSKTMYGASKLMKNIREMSLRDALAQTFLQLLSKYPDTHILKRGGRSLAERISYLSSRVLELGGVNTREGLRRLEELDLLLRKSWRMRPGATADLLASSITVVLLSGWTP